MAVAYGTYQLGAGATTFHDGVSSLTSRREQARHGSAAVAKGLSTNAPSCPVLRLAALRHALFLVDFVAGWSVLQESTNQQPNPQDAKPDAAQHGVGQGGAFVESP